VVLAWAACAAPSEVAESPDAGVAAPDAADDPAGPDAAPPTLGSEYVYDQEALRTYEVTIAPNDWQWLNDNARLEAYVSGTLTFEGQEYGPIGVRYKGGFGTLHGCFDAVGNRTCAKLPLKLKFNEYDDDLRFYGLKKLNFHSMKSDPSALHDRLGYSLYREAGVIGPRSVHARLVVNGEYLGLFALVEQIDGRFARDRFADGGEGNIYKEVWPVHRYPQPYLDALKTNEDEDPSVDRMMRFASALAGAADDTIEQVLEEWTDVDSLMAFLAVDRAIENWDGIVGFWCVGGHCGNHNFYWYEETTRDRVWLIPWDLDNTFDVPNFFVEFFGQAAWDAPPGDCEPVHIFDIGDVAAGRRAAACDDLVRWLGQTLRPRYKAAVDDLLAGPFALDKMRADLERWKSQIAEAVAEDRNGPTMAEWTSAVQELSADLATLRAQMEVVAAEAD